MSSPPGWRSRQPTKSNGAMQVIPGSHRLDQIPHRDTFAKHNLLTRGQEVAVEVDERQAVRLDLRPGEMSLHHVRLVHGSPPNTSDDRRIGYAIRYIPTIVSQVAGDATAPPWCAARTATAISRRSRGRAPISTPRCWRCTGRSPSATPASSIAAPASKASTTRAAPASMNFRAAVLHRPKQPMTVETVALGALKPGDVLVRIRAAGLCHTDLEVIEGQLAYPMPIVLGHEAAGTVEEVGKG